MSSIPLQPGIVYGPIFSRRLGRSLGINLLPSNQKICSFDCVYCQYGKTTNHTYTLSRGELPTIDDVLIAVERALKKPRTMDHLTFSGNGEPTLHPDFLDIVRGVNELRGRFRPEVKLAILSNASRVMAPEVIKALKMMDAPMMKLDAGDPLTFKAINQPVAGVILPKIIRGLKLLPNLMIQAMLIDGEISNIRGDAYASWKKILVELNPQKIQIYSTERPTAIGEVKAVQPSELSRIAVDLRDRFGLDAEAFWRN